MVRIIPDSLNHLTKISAADCFQIRTLSEERFVKKIGRISVTNLDEIKEAFSKVLSIENF
jgi:mRNA interferase MazF